MTVPKVKDRKRNIPVQDSDERERAWAVREQE
jgi:hypothetical protein